MGLLYYLDNKLRVHNTLHSSKRNMEPVVTLTSSVFNTMPNAGKRLLANGYRLQSTSCDVYGRYTWVFVLEDSEPTDGGQTKMADGPVGHNELGYDSQDEIFGFYSPNDPIVRRAIEISIAKGKFSTAMLQTYLGKGHSWVSGLANWLELLGVISEPNKNKPRDIFVKSSEEFDNILEQFLKENSSQK